MPTPLLALMLFAPHGGLGQQTSDEAQKLRVEILQKDIESLKAGENAAGKLSVLSTPVTLTASKGGK